LKRRLRKLGKAPEYAHEATAVPRYGHGRPSHPGLRDLLARYDRDYGEALRTIAAYGAELRTIPPREAAPGEPYWLNRWMPGLDSAAIYAFLRERRSARYVEIGSGISTTFAARARRDGDLDLRITAIDPEPRADIAELPDEWIRRPLQDADLSLFDGLGPGDVVYLDGSHRAVMNSDVVTFFLDVMPRLAPGVLVGVHDVFLPDDYLPDWGDWGFSEQYVLAAWLLGGAAGVRPVLASWYASNQPQLHGLVDWIWDRPALSEVERRGWAFWFEAMPRT
jgi:hypothetical protein